MPKATDEVIAEVKAKNPGVELEVISHPTYPDECIARTPTRAELRMYLARLNNPSEAAAANEFLVESCVLWPDAAGRAAVFERRPGLVEVWGIEIREITGLTVRATRRKV